MLAYGPCRATIGKDLGKLGQVTHPTSILLFQNLSHQMVLEEIQGLSDLAEGRLTRGCIRLGVVGEMLVVGGPFVVSYW